MRRHSVDLGALAVGSVELLNRQFEAPRLRKLLARPPPHMVIDHDDLLHGAFAERARVADDQTTAIIPDHAGEDFRAHWR